MLPVGKMGIKGLILGKLYRALSGMATSAINYGSITIFYSYQIVDKNVHILQ